MTGRIECGLNCCDRSERIRSASIRISGCVGRFISLSRPKGCIIRQVTAAFKVSDGTGKESTTGGSLWLDCIKGRQNVQRKSGAFLIPQIGCMLP